MNRFDIKKAIANMKICIPEEVEKELLELYENFATDDEGHEFPYTEQDIYEQLRKKLRLYEKASRPAVSLFPSTSH